MSHFTVMVIGDNIDELLAPYDEGIEVPSYFNGIVPNDEVERFMDYYKDKYPEDAELCLDDMYIKHGNDWNGYSWKFEKIDGIARVVDYSTYNPDSKWDWYSVGGRWSGFFVLKNGEAADQAIKKDIDIEKMRMQSKKSAIEKYDYVHSYIDGLPLEHDWKWYLEEVKAEYITIEEAREAYHAQPICKAFTKAQENGRGIIGFWDSIDEFTIPREQFIKDGINNTLVMYAFLSEDKGWVEKGQMGWWGMSDDKYTDSEWAEEFNKYFDSLPDDTLITLVDCHI